MDSGEDTIQRGESEFSFILGRSPGQKTRLNHVQFSPELFFLIAKFLASGPCQRSAKVSNEFSFFFQSLLLFTNVIMDSAGIDYSRLS